MRREPDDRRAKRWVRNALVGIAVALTVPLWLPVRLARLLGLRGELFLTCSQVIGAIPGLAGIFLRRGFYWMCLESYGLDSSVGFGTWIAHPETRIGRHVYIGGRCTLGTCEIGDDTLIGTNVDIPSGRRQHHFDAADRPIAEQGGAFTRVRIGRDCWIGNSAVVLADVGEGSVIGAGSVVVRPVPAGVVAAGNPCTVRRPREPQAVSRRSLETGNV